LGELGLGRVIDGEFTNGLSSEDDVKLGKNTCNGILALNCTSCRCLTAGRHSVSLGI